MVAYQMSLIPSEYFILWMIFRFEMYTTNSQVHLIKIQHFTHSIKSDEQQNSSMEIPSVNDDVYPRFVLHDLATTWVKKDPGDKSWFDNKDFYDLLENDLIQRIQSQLPSKILRRFYPHRSVFFI